MRLDDGLSEDRKLLKRIDEFGEGLTVREIELLESFMHRVDGGKSLTEAQRRIAVEIDERRVK